MLFPSAFSADGESVRGTRGRRPWRLGVGVLLVAGLVASDAGAGNNNYYKYRDADGTLHITNVRRSSAGWRLWKSFPGSGGDSVRTRPARRGPVNLSGARFHRYDTFIRGAAQRYQLPEALVRAVIHTESNYNPHAVSRVGAMGLMQLMPSTAKYLGVTKGFEPRQNIYGGSKLLRLLSNRFNGDMVLVLAGYHAGAGAVQKYGGVPPYESTRAYVRAVLRRYYAYERQVQLGGAAVRRAPARHIAG
jgi:hypothetical protein